MYFAAPWRYLAGGATIDTPIFTGMLMFDSFAVYMRGLLLFFLLLFISLTQISGVPAREEGTEFYVLIFGATLGMCLMVSANHMLIVFLAVEMVSVPSYVLAGLLKGRRRSSEAALKFAVFGAGTAGVMLYGISLLVGTLGSAHIPTMAARLADLIQTGAVDERTLVLILGGLMVAVGVSFKLSAVPFHFWAPDVFEGATAEVAAFLSIASKAAALGLLVRLTLGLGTASGADAMAALEPARQYMSGLVALLAAVTCTFGNLAAYGQTNMKRLLAYSTIAHAGYMMMAVAAAVALAGRNPAGAQKAVAALAFYAGIYLFMNLGAFAVVAFLRNALGSEEIADYAGLIRTSPGLVVSMGIILFSLVGLPPLAGFAAKFTVFAAMFDAGLLLLLVIGGDQYGAEPVLLPSRHSRDGAAFGQRRDSGGGDSALVDPGRVLFSGDAAAGGFRSLVERVVRLGQRGRRHSALLRLLDGPHRYDRSLKRPLAGPLPIAASLPGRQAALGAARPRGNRRGRRRDRSGLPGVYPAGRRSHRSMGRLHRTGPVPPGIHGDARSGARLSAEGTRRAPAPRRGSDRAVRGSGERLPGSPSAGGRNPRKRPRSSR